MTHPTTEVDGVGLDVLTHRLARKLEDDAPVRNVRANDPVVGTVKFERKYRALQPATMRVCAAEGASLTEVDGEGSTVAHVHR